MKGRTIMKYVLTSACVAFVGLMAVGAVAQSSAPGSSMAPAVKMASFCGAVVKLTEHDCIGVNSTGPADRGLYEITSAKPKPAVGTMIEGSGTPGGMTICMQGTHLTNVQWHKVAVCPAAK